MDGREQFWIFLGLVFLIFTVMGLAKHFIGMRCPSCRKFAVKTESEEDLPGRQGPFRTRRAAHTGRCGNCGQTFRRTVAKMPKPD